MAITDRVTHTLETNLKELNKKAEFVKLRDFYKRMQESGVAKKPAYSLPPLDTVGRRFRQPTTSKATR
ncbi:MAG: hypothetical protein HOP18_25775 [Deltaproteobacteria bacterium]|nr:hypothetical protein [Deltaproteobacteria bacterium]